MSEIRLRLRSRGGIYDATAVFDGEKYVVQRGSIINIEFAEHIHGGRIAKKYRSNPAYVDPSGRVIRDCEFNSPSTAAQFVTGSSCNGYLVWKDIENCKINLKSILGR